jgi:hypothetical protein
MKATRTAKSKFQNEGIEHFDGIISRFKAQRASGIQYLAFLSDLSDNDTRWEKYRDSFGGKIIHLAIITIENSLILFCSRLWDEAPDALSIPNAVLSAKHCIQDISDRHRLDLEGMSVPYDPLRFRKKLDEIDMLYEAAREMQARSVIRVMRSESLAHLLSDSRTAQRYSLHATNTRITESHEMTSLNLQTRH